MQRRAALRFRLESPHAPNAIALIAPFRMVSVAVSNVF
jgi:hypothetical protein